VHVREEVVLTYVINSQSIITVLVPVLVLVLYSTVLSLCFVITDETPSPQSSSYFTVVRTALSILKEFTICRL
jgi:hypothetical protein